MSLTKDGMVTVFKFVLGEGVKDVVSGFSGVILGRTEYLTGCKQYAVGPRSLGADGRLMEAQWFDEGRLLIDGEPVKLPAGNRGGRAAGAAR